MTDAIWDGFASAIVTLALPSGRHRLARAELGTTGGAFPFDADVHVVTAYNPAGIEASADDNRQRHAALLATVADLRTHPTVGSAPDGSIAEPGCAIVGIDTDRALALGRRFGQRAIYQWTPDALVIVGVDEPTRLRSGWRLTPVDRAEDVTDDVG